MDAFDRERSFVRLSSIFRPDRIGEPISECNVRTEIDISLASSCLAGLVVRHNTNV